MKPKIKLIANRILVYQDVADPKTASGIYLPGSKTDRSTKGTVIVTGPGMKDYKMETKPGDHVLYNHDSGIEIILEDGKTYLIMRETEVKMIL